MSSVYISARTAWFTHPDGSAVTDPAQHPEVRARVDALTDDQLEALADQYCGQTVVDYGLDEPTDEDFDDCVALSDEQVQKLFRAGAVALRTQLLRDIAALAEDTDSHVFDGTRWYAETGGYSHGDSPSDTFDWIGAVGLSGVADDPIGGSRFDNVPVLTATVAVVDEIAMQFLTAANTAAGRPGADVASVTAAIEACALQLRADVSRTADRWATLETAARDRAIDAMFRTMSG